MPGFVILKLFAPNLGASVAQEVEIVALHVLTDDVLTGFDRDRNHLFVNIDQSVLREFGEPLGLTHQDELDDIQIDPALSNQRVDRDDIIDHVTVAA